MRFVPIKTDDQLDLQAILNGNILKKAVPIFPPKTNCLHISGVVRVHAIIGKDGHVTRAQANFGAEIMRQPTVDAILQWVYRPFQLHGQPVEVETTITSIVHFNADGCEPPHS